MTASAHHRPLVPSSVATLEPFVHAGVLEASEVHLAAMLARRAPDTPAQVLLAAALAARATRLANVCADLATAATATVVDGADPRQIAALPWPALEAWRDVLAHSPLVSVGGPSAPDGPLGVVAPLVLEGTRVTLDRYARYERAVATDLTTRAGHHHAPLVDPAALDALLDRFFPPDGHDEPDLQRAAARVALLHPLAVISGGPGTGKTRTVARLLAAAQTAAVAQGRPLHVALAAPTGKAAARMAEAVRHEVAVLGLDPEVVERLAAAEALTIHRLLGHRDGIRFRHDADDPLPHDLVVVDETSMASLPLVARLLQAVRTDAHLVVVGDPDQLASVEAGAVLGEIIRAARPGSALAPVVVTLARTHRFGAGSPIALLAQAVRAGDADRALELLTDPATPDVRLISPANRAELAGLHAELAAAAEAQILAARAGDAAGALAAAGSVKVLAATRLGPNGVAEWQLRAEVDAAARLPDLDSGLRWYIGRPVMVTRNDRLTGLFNGDSGVLVELPDGPRVAFAGPQGTRLFEPGRLDALDTWWAMTIHKSQGSEFAHTVVALPEPGSPILTRELLYTAITRGRERVTVVASPDSVRAAVERQVPRASGLAELLSPA